MDDEKILKRRKKEMTEKAIREGGFYGRNGVWNSIITFAGDKRLYRERVETIIVKDGKMVFVKKKPDGNYYLPGGSTEKDSTHIEQAVKECQEEAHISVANIQSTGITYKDQHEIPTWAKNEVEVEWTGTFTEVYVADYDSTFKGHIDKVDEDPFIRSGKFYSTKECFKFFRKEHKDALLFYLKTLNNKDEEFTESYVSNYFKNRKLLKKISHNPEIERATVDQMISVLKKKYSEMSGTSKIQRERKRSDVSNIFHPILNFEFNDGNSITITICFDDKEFTEGAAFKCEELGDTIAIYPCFFSATKETQIFTLLHEFGHIRLLHLEEKNRRLDLFGKNNVNDYRLRLMKKGKVMYPEVNADMYAVLNGASMYAILSSSYNTDTDDKYDYRITNNELANRYTKVYKKYGDLVGYGYKESSYYKYDVACLAIYEKVYDNQSIDYLSESEKDNLYSILYEYCINSKIKDVESVSRIEKEYNNVLGMYTEKVNTYKNNLSNSMDISEDRILEDTFLEKINVIPSTTQDTINNELINMKEVVKDVYDELTYERSKAYEESVNNEIEITNHGKNIKMAKFSKYKSEFNNEVYETMNDIIYRLKIKEEECTENTENEKIKHLLYLMESLSSTERSKIPLENFGIPDTRSFPLDTEKHVRSAIKLFGRAENKYKPELAKRIFIAMDKYDISKDIIGKDSKLYEYIEK